jgi:Tol biopolymer transport system component
MGAGARLDSWKEIGAYLKREVRTVQRWEAQEGLPVHRHPHRQRSSVYAYRAELDAWWAKRGAALGTGSAGRSRKVWVAAAALSMAGVAGWLTLSSHEPQAPLRSYPMTASPGLESSPDFSPDGTKVAYMWRKEGDKQGDIYVKTLPGGNPLQLTESPEEAETRPTWSPDGRRIAFFGERSGRTHLLVMPAEGGEERRLGSGPWGPEVRGLCWTADGRWLIAPRAGGEHKLAALHAVSLATGESRKLLEPAAGGSDIFPAVSADGRTLAFVRVRNYGMARRIHLVKLTGQVEVEGEPEPLNQDPGNVDGIFWVGKGRTLGFVTMGCCSTVDTPGFWVLDAGRPGSTRLLFPVPGVQGLTGRLSPDGTKLAYRTMQQGNTGFYRVDLGREAAETVPSEIPSSTASNLNPFLAPSGRRFAYVSSRSGKLEVWTSALDGSGQAQVTNMPRAKAGGPRWSPDGSRIAFDSAVAMNPDIFVVNADGGEPVRLTDNPATECLPSWSNDGKTIYFVSNRTGRFEMWKKPAGGGEEVQLTRNGGYGGYESPDGKFFYYTTAYSDGDLKRVPAGAGEEEPLGLKIREVHDFKATRSALYFLAPCAECDRLEKPHVVRRYRFENGRIEEAARFRMRVRMGITVAQDDSFLIVNAFRRDGGGGGTGLTIVEGLRP